MTGTSEEDPFNDTEPENPPAAAPDSVRDRMTSDGLDLRNHADFRWDRGRSEKSLSEKPDHHGE